MDKIIFLVCTKRSGKEEAVKTIPREVSSAMIMTPMVLGSFRNRLLKYPKAAARMMMTVK